MGTAASLPFREFEFGNYWIGKPLAAVKRGLAFHFPTRMIKSVSSSELLKLGEDPPEGNEIVVIYDPKNGRTEHIVTGWEF